ncbi:MULTISPECIES: PadR family transcriptional regulator [unclassified Nonomuraea]|uniref:PadR family transcriptional regulator n=1 Tax=unclassified Nonomuraea TaxID=2593643 RepID=UPI0033E48E56
MLLSTGTQHHRVAEGGVIHGQAGGGDAQGGAGGHRPGELVRGAAYGYEITAWLREQGFSDIAEGTIYALLIRGEQRSFVDVRKVPPEGPPRKVCFLNAQGWDYLEECRRAWNFLTERLPQLREGPGWTWSQNRGSTWRSSPGRSRTRR